MTIKRRGLLTSLAAAALPLPAGRLRAATGPVVPAPPQRSTETIPLWPGPPPGSPPTPPPEPTLQKAGPRDRRETRLRGIGMPALFVYRPEQPNGAAILVMPGGGYLYLSVDHEGTIPARRFAKGGYTVFVLSYRLPGEGWTNRADAPIQDGLRAMRIIRARAREFRIDPERIGVMGFSAGGHLAASVAVDRGEALYPRVDAMDAEPARPAFAALAYAVTTLGESALRTASRRTLLGPEPSPALVERRSPLLHVQPDTPPCFVIAALDDHTVDPQCSIEWLIACRAKGVPVEAHLLERGGHGFGLTLPADNPGARWPELFRLWAQRHGG
jgi:acetyl esterase/lipase